MSDLAWPTLSVLGFGLALVVSAALSWVATLVLARLGVGQTVREDGPESHLVKTGTPQMAGIGFLLAIVAVCAACGLLSSRAGLSVVLVMLTYALIGFTDDFLKFARHSPHGWEARYRVPLQAVAAGLFVGLTQMAHAGPAPGNALWLYLFGVFVVAGGSNAVNLTDGLDGLAAGVAAIVAAALAVVGALLGVDPHAIATAAIVSGAAAGFLWVNGAPAQAFMGDVGSMGLGAAVCGLAVVMQVEWIFGVLSFVFVVEALSVIGQVISFQTTGKRILKMAPFHHHLEKSGWPEQRIVTRAWLLTALIAAGVVVWLLWSTHGLALLTGGPA